MPSALDVLDIEWLAWAAAAARVLPVALFVPAFGLRLLPVPMRFGLAAALAISVLPAIHPSDGVSGAFGLALVGEFVRGLPIAIAASAALFAATMAGGLVDDLRGVTRQGMDTETPMSVLFSLLAAVAFLETGGVSRIVGALTRPESGPTLARAAFDLAGAISVAVAILAPLVVVAIVFEVAAALMVRATGSWSLSGFVGPLRPLLILAAAGVAFERLAEAVVEIAARAP